MFVCILCTFVRVNEFSYDGIPKDGAFLTQVVHYVSVLGSGGIQFSVQRDCRCPQLESELVASLEFPLWLQQGFGEVNLVLNTITEVAGLEFEQVKVV